MISFYLYVRRSQVEAYLALGWDFVEDGAVYHHDWYSALMVWVGDGEPEFSADRLEATQC